MVQDDEAAVYHRDKRLDPIWWVCAEEFVTASTAVGVDAVVSVDHGSICTHAGSDELALVATQPGAADHSSSSSSRGMHEGRWDYRLS